MIKKHLLGGALLVSVLVLLTGCKEMMSSLDNPVSAYFEVTPTQATIVKNQTCQIKYSTISDGKVTFKSSAENIATVDANGLVTAKTAGTAIITVELAATPYYQGATKNVEISVDAVLSIDATEVTVGYGASINLVKDYHLARKGDATINYEIIEGSEFITLDETTKDITGKVCGNAKVKVSVPASATASSDELVIDVKARIQDLTQLKTAIAAVEEGGEYTALLSDEKIITIDETLDLTKKKVTLKGDDGKPAKITLSKSFVIYDNFTLENVDINASGVTGALLQLASSPTVAFLPKNDGSGNTDYYGIENITLKKAKITGVKGSILYDNNKKYCVVALTFDDCQFDLQTESVNNAAIISFQGGGVKDLTIKNSTFSGNDAVGRYFVRYNNSARIDRFGFVNAEDTWSFTYINNTFYNLLLDVAPNNDKAEWGNYGGMCANGKEKLGVITVNNNIWYNCDSQTMRRMLSSKNFSAFKAGSTMANNTFWFSGAAVDQGNYGNGSDLTTDPNFVNAPTNLKPQGEKQVTNQTGDPRWYKTN